MMKVTLYTQQDNPECLRVWDMLSALSARDDFELSEAPSPIGAPAPCIRFSAPGAPFYPASRLTESQFHSYFEEARKALLPRPTAASANVKTARKPGSLPDAAYEQSHPVRSFLWRHRVGALVTGLSAFLGVAWVAPLTTAWGWGDGLYTAVHNVYRLVCDQIPERSAHLNGLPACLCWRCTAIYTGCLVFGIVYTLGRDGKLGNLNMKWLTRPVSLLIMLLFGLPLILDGASHAVGLRPGTAYAYSPDFWLSWMPLSADWWLRIGTSLLAAVGAVKFLCPRMDKVGGVYEHLRGLRTGQRPEPSSAEPAVSHGPLSSI
ncbi:MAG: DUF2085 domain-containing protein [Chloroflexota bacterium]